MHRYGEDKEHFLALFNPDMQYRYCKEVERCFIGSAPTLATVADAYGNKASEAWVSIQLRDLSEFAGCKDKLTTRQIDQISMTICASFYYLKVTELMLFFIQFKSGKFGKFYGAVDGLVITEALQEFCKYRVNELVKYEEKTRSKELERQRKEWEKTCMTRDEWLELKWLFNMGYEPWRIKAELTEQRK